jgi:hypothetical protein
LRYTASYIKEGHFVNNAGESLTYSSNAQGATKNTVQENVLSDVLSRLKATPEQKLASHVLLVAMDDARQQAHNVPLRQRAQNSKEMLVELIGDAQWYLLDDNEHVEFSFLWCCEVLNFDPVRARRAVKASLRSEGVLLKESERWRLATICGQRRAGTYKKRRKGDECYAVA